MTLAIKITKFFGKVNIYILLDELSKKLFHIILASDNIQNKLICFSVVDMIHTPKRLTSST
jgi:hypothetical protein